MVTREAGVVRARLAAVVGVLLAVSGCNAQPPPTPLPSPSAVCGEPSFGVLPEWARVLTPPETPTNYFEGVNRRIVGVPFGWPLRTVQPSGRNNKILWVASNITGSGPLKIVATREGSGETVTREVANGPGPSIIDMPSDGCWRFDLEWTGGSDQMHVRYGDPA